MKTLIFTSSIFAVLLTGCEKHTHYVDVTPPAPPQGISTITGDGTVTLHLIRNTEPDLAGYHVFVSDRFEGRYTIIGTSKVPEFVHFGAVNGVTYYYAVTAFDFDGNEGDFSYDVVYDTPRPEGFGIVVRNYRIYPFQSGYDFSTFSVGLYDDEHTDIFYEYASGAYFMNVWSDTDIQDMGYTKSLDEITAAPANGWSPSKYVELIEGHTYVVWTWDDHYAKFRVTSVSSLRVVFSWAYQIATGNPELMVKRPVVEKRDMLGNRRSEH